MASLIGTLMKSDTTSKLTSMSWVLTQRAQHSDEFGARCYQYELNRPAEFYSSNLEMEMLYSCEILTFI
jgi:hypothetical protein